MDNSLVPMKKADFKFDDIQVLILVVMDNSLVRNLAIRQVAMGAS